MMNGQAARSEVGFVGLPRLDNIVELGKSFLKSLFRVQPSAEKNNKSCHFCKLPNGWKVISSGDVIDLERRKRGHEVFISGQHVVCLEKKFSVVCDYERWERRREVVVHVMDCGEVIFSTTPEFLSLREGYSYRDGLAYLCKKDIAFTRARKKALAWLKRNYPDWRNPGAYWD